MWVQYKKYAAATTQSDDTAKYGVWSDAIIRRRLNKEDEINS
jgi:hypothetical protein